MRTKTCRPANRARVYQGNVSKNVATTAMQDALWATAASAPERFVQGCKDAAYSYLSEWPEWFTFKQTLEHRVTAEQIIVLAKRLGIAERPPRAERSFV